MRLAQHGFVHIYIEVISCNIFRPISRDSNPKQLDLFLGWKLPDFDTAVPAAMRYTSISKISEIGFFVSTTVLHNCRNRCNFPLLLFLFIPVKSFNFFIGFSTSCIIYIDSEQFLSFENCIYLRVYRQKLPQLLHRFVIHF